MNDAVTRRTPAPVLCTDGPQSGVTPSPATDGRRRRVIFTIPGEPTAQGRPRANVIFRKGPDGVPAVVNRCGKDGRAIPVINVAPSRGSARWQDQARLFAHQAMAGIHPFTGPVAVSCVFILPRRRMDIWKRKPMPEIPAPSRPDIDNYVKALFDGLNGTVFADDAQVVDIRARKVYAPGPGYGDTRPRVEVMVEEIQ